MSKKMKKSPELSELQNRQQFVPLDDVTEDQAIELELDEETREIIQVFHFRIAWGDPIDDDIEYPMTVDEAKQYIMTLVKMVEDAENIGKEISTQQVEEENKEDESLP